MSSTTTETPQEPETQVFNPHYACGKPNCMAPLTPKTENGSSYIVHDHADGVYFARLNKDGTLSSSRTTAPKKRAAESQGTKKAKTNEEHAARLDALESRVTALEGANKVTQNA